jgi:hypothetical protein
MAIALIPQEPVPDAGREAFEDVFSGGGLANWPDAPG